MKIEIELATAHHHPEVGQSALLALMSVLPQDEVELAVAEWRAVIAVRNEDMARGLELEEKAAEPSGPAAAPRKRGRPHKEPAEAPPATTPLIAAEPQPEPTVVADIADTLSFGPSTPAAPEPVRPEPAKPNGQLASLSLRELCRHAELEAGREKVVAVLAEHGVTKLVDLAPEREAAVRASIMGLLA